MLGRIRINLPGGATPTTTTTVWDTTTTTTVSACETSSDSTTTGTELLTDQTDQNWLKNAVFYAALTSTVWLISLVLSKYRSRFINACTDYATKMTTENRQSKERSNRNDAEIKSEGSKNEERSKNEEEITEVEERPKKQKKRDSWMPGPDWARLNRQWRERKREEKIQEKI